MDKKKKEVRFSSREVDILYILWNAGKPMLASEILAVDQKLKPATVNTALKKMLEKELNAKLFNRSTRRVELTPEGEVFLGDAGYVLQSSLSYCWHI